MKTIRHKTTLFYYDGPQVIEARDAIGGHYLAVMTNDQEDGDRYLVVGIAPEQLRQFREGSRELRSLLIESGREEWYLGKMTAGLEEPMVLDLQHGSLPESDLLPDDGFVLHDRPAEDLALKEARSRHNVVLEVAVDPPEAAEEHRIRIGKLVGLLSHWQMLVKHAYGAALRQLSLKTRRAIDRSDAHLLDVVIPAATGSFRVVMEGAKVPNLLGQSELARALSRVDKLFAVANDPEKAIAMLKANRGHLSGAYLRMLSFLVNNKMGVRYSWAEPTSDQPSSGGVSEAEAIPLVAALSEVANLGSESVDLTGKLEKADVVSGVWRIATTEGSYSGKSKSKSHSLAGLIIGNNYHFSCVEEIKEVEGTGLEQRRLYLLEYHPL
jgi:hypothetical protein